MRADTNALWKKDRCDGPMRDILGIKDYTLRLVVVHVSGKCQNVAIAFIVWITAGGHWALAGIDTFGKLVLLALARLNI